MDVMAQKIKVRCSSRGPLNQSWSFKFEASSTGTLGNDCVSVNV